MLASAIRQHGSVLRILSPTLRPITRHSVVTEHLAQLLVLHTNFTLAVCFTRGDGRVSTLLSQSIPPSPSPTVSIDPFSVCLYSYPTNRVHQCHFSGSHIYALLIQWFWLPSLCVTGSSFIHLARTDQIRSKPVTSKKRKKSISMRGTGARTVRRRVRIRR